MLLHQQDKKYAINLMLLAGPLTLFLLSVLNALGHFVLRHAMIVTLLDQLRDYAVQLIKIHMSTVNLASHFNDAASIAEQHLHQYC